MSSERRNPEFVRYALIELVKVRGFAYVDPVAEKEFRNSLTPEERDNIKFGECKDYPDNCSGNDPDCKRECCPWFL